MHYMAFIHRNIIRTISGLLAERPVVLVQGPPRCGRSTIARQLAASSATGAILVDARRREGRAVIADPGGLSAAKPIVLDNAGADEAAAIVSWAAGRADGIREGGERRPRFVLVGGPFPETGGEAAAVEAGPLSLFEAGRASMRALWLRGGYPEAYGAASDEAAFDWLEGYAADLAHGVLADWGLPREPGLVTSLLEAAAAGNGRAFNENAAARALGVSRPTVNRYLAVLHHAGILFSLPALPAGFLKAGGVARAVRAPALYVRDSGLLHALLGVRSPDGLAQKPRAAAASWAGFVAAQALQSMPPGVSLCRYASADGAALELVALRDGRPVLLAATKRHRPASVERSISYAARAVSGDRERPGRYIVVPDGAEGRLPGGFYVVGIGAFLERLADA